MRKQSDHAHNTGREQSNFSTLWKMLGLVQPLAGFMALAIAAGTAAYLAVQFIPILGGYAILQGIAGSGSSAAASGIAGGAGPLSLRTIWILLPVLALVRAVLRFTEQRLNHYIAFTLLAIVRDRVFAALRRLCPAKLESRDKGDLVALITADVELLEVFFAHTISPIGIAILTETIMCLFIGSFHVVLGLTALTAFLCVGILVPLMISHISGDMGDKVRSRASSLSSYVLENIRGLDETIQYSAGEERMDGMRRKTDSLMRYQGALSRLTGLNLGIANTCILVFDILMTAIAGWLYFHGSVSLEGFLIPTIALMSSFGPVSALAGLGTTLQNTAASGARILSIIEEEPVTEEITGEKEITFDGAVCRDVTFGYHGAQEANVLENFSMEIPANRITGIVGESGCGKSTLLRLLMRFWETDGGEIAIRDGSRTESKDVPIDHINTSNLRDMESYMTQDTELFKDTIAGNIRIARLDASQEQIEEACRKASLHDWIMTLPSGYETNVGELGETLSGGERQRIGLARAFLHDAPFMLLDEPTSNLDSLNEAVILKALREEAAGRTILLVSHRKSTMRAADDVIEMA